MGPGNLGVGGGRKGLGDPLVVALLGGGRRAEVHQRSGLGIMHNGLGAARESRTAPFDECCDGCSGAGNGCRPGRHESNEVHRRLPERRGQLAASSIGEVPWLDLPGNPRDVPNTGPYYGTLVLNPSLDVAPPGAGYHWSPGHPSFRWQSCEWAGLGGRMRGAPKPADACVQFHYGSHLVGFEYQEFIAELDRLCCAPEAGHRPCGVSDTSPVAVKWWQPEDWPCYPDPEPRPENYRRFTGSRALYTGWYKDAVRVLRENRDILFWVLCLTENLTTEPDWSRSHFRLRDCVLGHILGEVPMTWTVVDWMEPQASAYEWFADPPGRADRIRTCAGEVGVIWRVHKGMERAYVSGDPDHRFRATVALASYIVHELVHVCGGAPATHQGPDDCWDEALMVTGGFLWAMSPTGSGAIRATFAPA